MSAVTFGMRALSMIVLLAGSVVVLCVLAGAAISAHDAFERWLERRLATRRAQYRSQHRAAEVRQLETMWRR